MTVHRVMAYAMHEHEHYAASRDMAAIELEEDAYVIGTADDAGIDALRAAGLIVEIIDPDAERAARRSATTAGAGGPTTADRPLGPLAPGASGSFELTATRPLRQDERDAVQATGAIIAERLGAFTWAVVATNEQAELVSDLGFVHSIDRPGIDGWGGDVGAPSAPAAPAAPVLFDVVVDDGFVPVSVELRLADLGAEIVAVADRRIRVRIPADHPLALDFRSVPGVAWGFVGDEAELHLDRVRELVGVGRYDDLDGTPGELDGDGEIVAVLDTGVDVGHPDLAGRVHATFGVDGGPDVTDRNGHGTHVAGIILGDGTASTGRFRGIAPAARLVAQSSADGRGGLVGLPTTIADRLAEAYHAGARVINNSWGTRRTPAEYTVDAWQVDEFVWQHPDLVVVFSAGNDASDLGTAFVDGSGFSITPPGTAKNVITVGAARSDRQSGGGADDRWGDRYPRAASRDPLASETVAGDPQRLAAFSGRGPVTDRRIKPDVVAPGTSVCSTRSSSAIDIGQFAGVADPDVYLYNSGTSMAAPSVAGVCALVRQWYRRQGITPSAALVRATVVNGTRWLTGSDAEHGQTEPPNNDQGFGAVDLRMTLPSSAHPTRTLRWADTWDQPARQFTRDGMGMTWEVDVRAGTPLRICLAYTDAPGRGVQNDLNLYCEAPGQIAKTFANVAAPGRIAHGLDKDNAVEIVRIADPTPGPWKLRIACGAITRRHPLRGQDYALVVSGDLDGDLRFHSY